MLIEHNELLSRRGETSVVMKEFFRVICSLDEWEELRVGFGEHDFWAEHGESQAGIDSVVDWIGPSWVVPLANSTTVENIVAGLSRNRRHQIRRTL